MNPSALNPPPDESDTTQIAWDIPGSEGPLVTKDGKIFVVAPNDGTVLEIGPDGQKSVLANTKGIPAGLQLHRDGSIWVADMRLGILRITRDGRVTTEVGSFDAQPIRGCNDCAFDSEGNLYFTAPAGSCAEIPVGEVYCRLANGEVRRMDGGYAFSNGLAVSADDRLLVVAETFTKKLYGYRLDGPGEIQEKFLFATLPGDHFGGPDGMDFDENGNLIATNLGAGTLEVYGPDGTHVRQIPLPFDKPSNVHFAGPGSHTLLITEHTHNGLWKTRWNCAGQRQFGWR